jgi:aspartyl-tRNA(Asn)/glutamyl-tRNA(Gln) amidotransferase subunit B
MQEGSLRCDANVNLHIPQPDGSVTATPIVEVKNLNSIAAVERAMRYETQRQYEQFQKDGKKWGDAGVHKATAGWDEDSRTTRIQRRKEEAADYRYFPDPDLVPVTVAASRLDEIRAALGELPAAQRARLPAQYGLSAYDAGVLTRQGRAFVGYFEEAARLCGDAKETANWLANDVLQALNERKQAIKDFAIPPAGLADLIREIKATGLNKQRSREVFAEMLAGCPSAKQAMDKLGIKVIADRGQLAEIVRRAIAANPKAVADFKKGKTKAADAIKGAVMRETKGMARTELVQEILLEELQKEHAEPEASS